MVKGFWQAVTFLTTIPTPSQTWEPGDLGRAGGYFPMVGLLLGTILYIAWWGLHTIFPPTIAAILVVVLWAALTGGLHLDGLADCGDGLLAAVSTERRLEILKDSRIGAFGAITLILHLFLKVAAVATLTTPWGLLLATVTSRWLILPTAKRPLARPGGMGAEFSTTLSSKSLTLGALLPLVFAAGLGWAGLLALTVACVLTTAVWQLASKRLGGMTGDIFGLVVELSEIAILLCFTAL